MIFNCKDDAGFVCSNIGNGTSSIGEWKIMNEHKVVEKDEDCSDNIWA